MTGLINGGIEYLPMRNGLKIQSEFGKQSIRLSDYDKGGPLEGQSPEDLLLVGLSPEEMTARDNQKNVLNEVQLKLDAEFTAKKALRENGGILARVLSRPVVIIGILSLLIGGAFLYSCNKNKTKQNHDEFREDIRFFEKQRIKLNRSEASC